MRVFHSDRGITSIQVGAAVALVLLLFFLVTFFLSHKHSNWLKTELEKSNKKTQLIQSMKSDLLASAEAEKSSVMADMVLSGHKSWSVFEQYNITNEADLREAARKQEIYLESRVGTNSGTIVDFKEKRG